MAHFKKKQSELINVGRKFSQLHAVGPGKEGQWAVVIPTNPTKVIRGLKLDFGYFQVHERGRCCDRTHEGQRRIRASAPVNERPHQQDLQSGILSPRAKSDHPT